jgi:hypothetical protein
MLRPLAFVALAVLVGVVLAATVFRNDIAQATGLAQAVTVTNTAANPVPVEGTVSGRPAAPASPWSSPLNGIPIGGNFTQVLAGPSASPINITSLSASVSLGSQAVVNLIAFNVPDTATDCSGPGSGAKIIFVLVNVAAPIAVPFPTPLQWAPPAGQKACLTATAGGVPGGSSGGTLTVNASGFFGS